MLESLMNETATHFSFNGHFPGEPGLDGFPCGFLPPLILKENLWR